MNAPSTKTLPSQPGDDLLYRGCHRKIDGQLYAFLHFARFLRKTVWVKLEDYDAWMEHDRLRKRVSHQKKVMEIKKRRCLIKMKLCGMNKRIVQLAERGKDVGHIAVRLNIPVSLVNEVLEERKHE